MDLMIELIVLNVGLALASWVGVRLYEAWKEKRNARMD